MKLFRYLAVIAGILSLTAGMAWAGSTTRVGTSGASELRMQVGARSIALGGSDLAMVSGAEAMFYNPAGVVATQSKTELLFSNSRLIDDMQLNYFAVMQAMGDFGTIGVSAKVLSIGDIIQTTENAPDGTGATFSPTFSVIGLTYGKAMTDRVNFGGSLQYSSEKILQETAAGVAFDFGFQYDTGVRGIRVGAAMQNFGSSQLFSGEDLDRNLLLPEDDPQSANRTLSLSTAGAELPSLFTGSASWPVMQGVNALTLHGVYQSNSFNVDEFRLGAEYLYRKQFALRLGYKATSNSSELFGLTYGLGVQVPIGSTKMDVDYAGQSVSEFFSDVQHLGLTFRF